MSKCIEATKANVDKVMEEGVVFVSFWAPWCGPCRSNAPIIENIAEDFCGKATVLNDHTDDLQEIAMKFKIRAVPTGLVLKDGKEVSRRLGASSKEEFEKMINNALSGGKE